MLDGVAERPAARAPVEMERKRARSDDSDESFVVRRVARRRPAGLRVVRHLARRRRQQHAAVAAARPARPRRVERGPARPRQAAQGRRAPAGGGAAAPRGRVTTIPRAKLPASLSAATVPIPSPLVPAGKEAAWLDSTSPGVAPPSCVDGDAYWAARQGWRLNPPRLAEALVPPRRRRRWYRRVTRRPRTGRQPSTSTPSTQPKYKT